MASSARELAQASDSALQSLRASIAEDNGFGVQLTVLFDIFSGKEAKRGIAAAIDYLKALQSTEPETYEGFVSKYGLDGIVGLDVYELRDEDVAYVID